MEESKTEEKIRILYVTSAAIVFAAWVFAPLVLVREAYTRSCGYRFFETCTGASLLHSCIDWPVLLIEWIGILICTFFLYQYFKE